ncbi:LysM peptidoglycan-binding domain-containing protein [Arcanobacterium buesumense]|uniref:LysM peptidoglycan-binding domain-containing protein n=1 Tax=Arcanobacterium buesumense TaxID=2722751 RepID=A0A6H2EJS9_9ACTO|nr:LysM peptidoglycan-binding domain-containing protein [Arcanobacterium buesumense]QJC21596.1 LysM peptidoglycan-binding domain-containing protein [Arcanobacterium buesumense]
MSVIDIREYERVAAPHKIERKASLRAVPQQQRHINAVPKYSAGPQRSERIRHVVRPDKPISSTLRSLYAVPTAASAAQVSESDVHWRIESARTDAKYQVSHQGDEGDIPRQIVMGLVYARRLLDSFSIRQVLSFIGVMAMSVVAGLAVVTIFGLSPEAGQTRVVQPGDTLVSIAESLEAPVPQSQIVSDIYALNVIDGNVVQPGQRLVMPRY